MIKNTSFLENKKINSIVIKLGALALFLAIANPIIQIPLLIFFYPAALYYLGKNSISKKQALYHGFLCGWLGNSMAIYWIAIAVHDYGNLSWLVGGACVVLLALVFTPWTALFSLAIFGLRKQSLWRLVLTGALLWLMLEFLRNYAWSGFPWLSLAQAFAGTPILMQGLSIFGAYGLSALIALIGILLVEAINSKACLILALALFSLNLGYGYFRLADNSLVTSPKPELNLALIQGNIAQDLKWSPENNQMTLSKYLNLSRQSLASKPDLIIFPETAIPFYFQDSNPLSEQLSNFAKSNQVALFFGSPAYERNNSKKAYTNFNRAYLLDANGEVIGKYDKEHLVPFGEYLPPLPFMSILEPILQGLGAFTPGDNQVLPRLESKDLTIGVQICYEAIFAELAEKSVEKGAELFINISNDAWYGFSSAPEQHLHLSVLRAVEQGRYMARATNTGVSAFIDPYGRIQNPTELYEDAYLVGTVKLLDSKTYYYYIFPYLVPCSLLFIILLNLNMLFGLVSKKSK